PHATVRQHRTRGRAARGRGGRRGRVRARGGRAARAAAARPLRPSPVRDRVVVLQRTRPRPGREALLRLLHAQVVDLETGAVVGHSDALAPGTPGSSAVDLNASGSRLAYEPATKTWTFAVSRPGRHVSLRQQPEKPY